MGNLTITYLENKSKCDSINYDKYSQAMVNVAIKGKFSNTFSNNIEYVKIV